jgi:hypothetical protein
MRCNLHLLMLFILIFRSALKSRYLKFTVLISVNLFCIHGGKYFEIYDINLFRHLTVSVVNVPQKKQNLVCKNGVLFHFPRKGSVL